MVIISTETSTSVSGSNSSGIFQVQSGSTVFGSVSGDFTIYGSIIFSGLTNIQALVSGVGGSNSGNVVTHVGSFVGSGNASTTIYNISHGIGAIPSSIHLEAASPQARATVDVSGTASGIVVTFPIAPASGDVRLYWSAGPTNVVPAFTTSGRFQLTSGSTIADPIVSFSGTQMFSALQSDAVYVAWISGTTVRVMNTNTGIIEYSGTNVISGIQYGVNSAHNKGSLRVKPGTYDFEGPLELADKNVAIKGEVQMLGSAAGRPGDTIFRKRFASTSGMINVVHTGYAKAMLEKLVIEGSGNTGIGIDADEIVETEFIRDVSILEFDIGLRIMRTVFVDIYNLTINNCGTYGLQMWSAMIGKKLVNTTKFFGGRISNSPVNVRAENVNECVFFGTTLEGATSGNISSTSGASYMSFYGCTLENNDGITAIQEDFGTNNLYMGCGFGAASGAATTLIRFGAQSRGIRFQNNFGQAQVSGDVFTIQINSGANNISIIGNTRSTKTIGRLDLVDNSVSGADVVVIGNTDISDRTKNGFTIGASGVRLVENAGVLEVRDESGLAGIRKNMLAGSMLLSSVRSLGNVDIIMLSGTQSSFVRPVAFASGVTISGVCTIMQHSGWNWVGAIGTTKTETAANSGAFAPLGYITMLVSGVSARIPYFAA